LTGIRQIIEMIEECDRLGKRPAVCRRVVHDVPLQPNPEGRHRFNVSAVCHVLLHPIGLCNGTAPLDDRRDFG
jgi:hypothetical protein